MKQKLVTIFWNTELNPKHSSYANLAWYYPETDITEHLAEYLDKGWAIDSMTPIVTGAECQALLAVLLVK